jgi:hypothetical protein
MNKKSINKFLFLVFFVNFLKPSSVFAGNLDQFFYRLDQREVPFNGLCYSSLHNLEKVKKGVYGEKPPCATANDNPSPTPQKNPATPPTTQTPSPNNQTSPPANDNLNSASPPMSPQEATQPTTPPSAYQRFTGIKPAN